MKTNHFYCFSNFSFDGFSVYPDMTIVFFKALTKTIWHIILANKADFVSK